MQSTEHYDYAQMVSLVPHGQTLANLTLAEAVRLVVEEFPANTAKQPSAMIMRKRQGGPV